MLTEAEHNAPTPEEIRAELARVLVSPEFEASEQLTRFLRYIVETTLAGGEARIKERTVAIHALARETDFDPRLDPGVRMAAGKLRRALERFYGGEGANSSVRIEVPKGSYRPAFVRIAAAAVESLASDAAAAKSVPTASGEHATRPVVAVAPFALFTRGAAERLLADSIAQDVCIGLSRFSWFEVIDLAAVRGRFAGGSGPLEMAAESSADFCLSGTVRRQGGLLRTSVQLVETSRGKVLWAGEFDLRAGDERVSAFDGVTRRIVAAVGDIFGALAGAVWQRARGKPPENLSACEAVLCNLRYQSQLADGQYASAMETAKRALAADPEFAWGWAAMATLHLDNYAHVARGSERNPAEAAMECIGRALKADPENAFAHWTFGLYQLMNGRIDEAIEAAERTVNHAHGSPFETGAAGALLSVTGNHTRGRQLIDEALELNPRLPGWIHWGRAISDFGRGDFRTALATSERFSLPDCFWDHLLRAAALGHAGETEQARGAVQQARRLRPELERRPERLIGMIVGERETRTRILEGWEVAGSRAG